MRIGETAIGIAAAQRWGAVILTILRFIQGIGVGGEWGGSVLMGCCASTTLSHFSRGTETRAPIWPGR
jgi:hypothetical protein